MKILGGQLKGRNFYMPAGIRPTQDILRAAIFDLLGHDIEGLTFLDLFAGSGAVGLEAVSRGAAGVTMVERDPKHADTIRENCRILGIELGEQNSLIEADAFATIKDMASRKKCFDIVFFDPPFGQKLGKKTLKCLGGHDILHAQSFLIAQYDLTEMLEVPEGMVLLTGRRYGSSYLNIFQKVTK